MCALSDFSNSQLGPIRRESIFMTIISVDLAYKNYHRIGIVVLKETDEHIAVETIRTLLSHWFCRASRRVHPGELSVHSGC